MIPLRRLCLQAVFTLLLLLPAACTLAPHPSQQRSDVYLRQVLPLLAEQQYGQALLLLQKAADAQPHNPEPLLQMGQIYLQQQRWLPAEDAFNQALARDSGSALAQAGLAEARLNQGDWINALARWQTAADLDPALPGVFTGLGRTYLSQLEFDKAQAAFEQQQQQQPDPEAGWYLAALAAPYDVTAANERLLAISADAPPDVLARRDYLLATLVPFTADSSPVVVAQATGAALVQAGLWPLAVQALTIAQENDAGQPPESRAKTRAFLGHALAQMKRPALDLFAEARQLDPSSALPAYFYGLYLRQQGVLNVAEQEFNQAIELDPDNAAMYVELARTHEQAGDFAAAEAAYQAAVALAPDNADVRLAQVRFHAGRGYRIEEVGIPAAQALIKADETLAEAHDWLGWMYFLSGQLTEAETAFQEALTHNPHLVSAHYHLARWLAQQQQPQAARVQYQRVIDLDRTGLYRDRALQEIQPLLSDAGEQ